MPLVLFRPAGPPQQRGRARRLPWQHHQPGTHPSLLHLLIKSVDCSCARGWQPRSVGMSPTHVSHAAGTARALCEGSLHDLSMFLTSLHTPQPPLQIMVLSTFLPLVAGRFGLAPTSTRHTNAGVKLQPQDKAAGLYSNDPAGEREWQGQGWTGPDSSGARLQVDATCVGGGKQTRACCICAPLAEAMRAAVHAAAPLPAVCIGDPLRRLHDDGDSVASRLGGGGTRGCALSWPLTACSPSPALPCRLQCCGRAGPWCCESENMGRQFLGGRLRLAGVMGSWRNPRSSSRRLTNCTHLPCPF